MNDIESMQLALLQERGMSLANAQAVVQELSFSPSSVHIDRALIRNGVYQTAEAHPILRAGGLGAYAEITPEIMFDLPRVTATSWTR